MIYSKKNIILLILLSFLSSIFLSYNYLSKYDKYSKYNQKKHPMIKIAIENHWMNAHEIVSDVKKGKSLIQSGLDFSDEYLPGKLLAIYYLATGDEIYEDDIIKADNGKYLYLVIKTLFYYFAVYFFYKRLIKIFNLKQSFFSVIFLIFLPDLFQYHSSFWNESLFFSFQIILLSLVISNNFSITSNILIGILFSLIYLISQEYIFYLIVFIIYYLSIKIKYNKSFLKLFFSFLIGFSILTSIQSYESKLKTGNDQLVKGGVQSALYVYVVPSIISKSNNIGIQEAKKSLRQQSINWAEMNNIKYEKNSNFILKISSKNFDDKAEYNRYMFKKSITTILSHPIISGGLFLESAVHLVVLNPFYIKYFYQYNGKGEFLKTQTHKDLIPIRIIYSLIIYGTVFLGLIKSQNIINDELNLFLFLSVCYIFFVGGWLGIPRYFTPALIFMSIYFGIFFGTKNFIPLKKDKIRV